MSRINVIALKRAYDPASPDDGFRIYVDRLWPRGLSHATFKYDLWDKEIAPSTELREWYHQNPSANWDEFVKRYRQELANNQALGALKQIVEVHPMVTLLYSSQDTERNNAIVLRQALEEE